TLADSAGQRGIRGCKDDLPQRDADIRCQDVRSRLLRRHGQPVMLSGAFREPAPDLGRPRLGGRRMTGADLAVHERVEARVRQSEGDVRVPTGADVLDRITGVLHGGLLPAGGVAAEIYHSYDESLVCNEGVIYRGK